MQKFLLIIPCLTDLLLNLVNYYRQQYLTTMNYLNIQWISSLIFKIQFPWFSSCFVFAISRVRGIVIMFQRIYFLGSLGYDLAGICCSLDWWKCNESLAGFPGCSPQLCWFFSFAAPNHLGRAPNRWLIEPTHFRASRWRDFFGGRRLAAASQGRPGAF